MAQSAMRILQIEDDPNEVFFFAWVVRRWNVPLTSYVVSSAPAAIEYLQALGATPEDRPHLLLIDIHLPQMNGFELLQAIKSRSLARDIPVVMFSNSGDPVDIQRARDLGADAYVVKPDDPAELASILHSIYESWQRHEIFRGWPDELSVSVSNRLARHLHRPTAA